MLHMLKSELIIMSNDAMENISTTISTLFCSIIKIRK